MTSLHQNWSLPDQLLDLIVQHIDDKKDVIAFGMVQLSWRQAALRRLYDCFVVSVPPHLFEKRRKYLRSLENFMSTAQIGGYVAELVIKMKILQDDEVVPQPLLESSATSTSSSRSINIRPTSPKGLVQLLRSLRRNSSTSNEDLSAAPVTPIKTASTPSMNIAIYILSIIDQCHYLRKLTLDFGKERFRMSLNSDYLFRTMLQNEMGASTIKDLAIIDLPKLYLPHDSMTEWISSLKSLEKFTASKVPSNFFTPEFQQGMAKSSAPINTMTLKDITLWNNEDELEPNLWLPPALKSLRIENCSQLLSCYSILVTVASSCPELRELYIPILQEKPSRFIKYSGSRTSPLGSPPPRNNLEYGLYKILQQCQELQVLDLAGNTGISDAVLMSIATHGQNLKQLHLDDCRGVTGRNLEWRSSYQLEMMSMSGCHAIEPRFLATVRDFCPRAEIWA
ncbi:hypothetical protein BGW37DRAFT_490496 [Umbelopsis sp. PMI_123]|nr:hypothetical protein BGW37DRAFT_490496 [Umbelopsis sp. PMI_123]